MAQRAYNPQTKELIEWNGSEWVKIQPELDTASGAPLPARLAVAGATKPEDRLATIQKFYPDAKPFGTDNFVFTNPKTGRPTLFDEQKKIGPFNVPSMRDVADEAPMVGRTVGGLVGGAIGSPAGPVGVAGGVGLGSALGEEATKLALGKLTKAQDTRSFADSIANQVSTAAIDSVTTFGMGGVARIAGEQAIKRGMGISRNEAARAWETAIKPKITVAPPAKPKIDEAISNPGKVVSGEFKQAQVASETGVENIFQRPQLTVEAHRAIDKEATELLTKGGVPRDPHLKLYEQIDSLVRSGRIPTEEFHAAAQRAGVSPSEFVSDIYGVDVSRSGKVLQSLSAVQKALGTAGKDGEKIELPGMSKTQRILHIWRGSLVSQLSTAMRNAWTSGFRVGITPVQRTIDFAIQKLSGKVNQNQPLNSAWDVFGQLHAQLRPRESIQLTKKMLEIHPHLYDQIMRQYSADVTLNGGKGVLAKASKAVYYMNVWNRAQDVLFRSAWFTDSLRRRLAANGNSLEAVIKSGQMGSVPKEMLEASVNDALEATFSANAKSELGRKIIDVIDRIPPVSIAIPFPRFLFNGMRFIGEHSPLGFLPYLPVVGSKAAKAAIKAGDFTGISKAIVGSGMLVGAIALRQSEYAGERWYELKVGDKRFDMRPFMPFSAYLYAADIYARASNNTLFAMDWRDIVQGFTGSQVRGGTGFYIVDGLAANMMGDAPAGDKAMQIMKRVAGEWASGFMVPFTQIKDVFGQFDKEERTIRNVEGSPLLGPSMQRLPFASRDLPPALSPTQSAPLEKQEPLVRQVTGITQMMPKNAVQQELDRLQFTRDDYFRSTGHPEIDQAIIERMGPLVERFGSMFVSGNLYKTMPSDNVRRFILKEVMKGFRELATEQALAGHPEWIKQLKYESLPKSMRRILEQDMGYRSE